MFFFNGRFLFVCLLSLLSFNCFSQSSFGTAMSYMDPALAYNQRMHDQYQAGTYRMIGQFKVTGTSYLYGEKHDGNLFSANDKGNSNSAFVSYNTYTQEVESYPPGSSTPLVKRPGELDSFTIKRDSALGIQDDIKFVYGPVFGATEKSYLQLIEAGQHISIYKRYKSDLVYPTGDYNPTDMRQFDLSYDYFYYNSDTKTLKKLKSGLTSIIKEFKNIKDVSAITNNDEYSANPEEVLKRIVVFLNN